MQPNPNFARVRPQLEQMASFLGPVFRQSVTPIGAYHAGRTIQWGTGTFFRVGDASFLVTATHVWLSAKRHKLDLCVFDTTGTADGWSGMAIVPLHGQVYFARDPADVAVVELPDETVGQLTNRRFLHLNQVALHPATSGCFWVYGFPQEGVREDVSGESVRYHPLLLVGGASTESGEDLSGFDMNFHFLLDADRNNITSLDGSPGAMPDRLEGISGCAVWQMMWPGQTDFDPSLARIVGVQISYYRKTSIVSAVRWGVVAHVLRVRRPDLRGIIEMHLGPP
jgi:hypothetical protein